MIWVALAGPLTNLILAVASVYALKLMDAAGEPASSFVVTPLALMAQSSVNINVMLAAFNLFPVPPLDGGRVLVGLLPEPYSSTVARVEPYGFLILLVLLMTRAVDVFLNPVIRAIFAVLKALFVGW
jgi:Zn-dependent protease